MLTHLMGSWGDVTFKREFAIIAFIAWCILTHRVFYSTDVAIINALGVPYSTASTAVWLYIMSAFGMDFAAKQWSTRANSGVSVSLNANSASAPEAEPESTPAPASTGLPKLTVGGSATTP